MKKVSVFSHPKFKYFGLGVTTNRLDLSPSVVFVSGFRFNYFKLKVNPFSINAEQNYKVGFQGKQLDVSNQGVINNFPASSNSYYSILSSAAIKNTGILLGKLVPLSQANLSKTLSNREVPFCMFIGAGYAIRELYWGLQITNYSGASSSNYWAKNSNQSWTGPEVEVGLFLPLKVFFIQAGTSAIFDASKSAPFISFSTAIGYLRKK